MTEELDTTALAEALGDAESPYEAGVKAALAQISRDPTIRTCIGSEKFGLPRHDAPIADFPAQPSQKDGLGRMCKRHWTLYTRALRQASQAAKGYADRTLAVARDASAEAAAKGKVASPKKPARPRAVLKPETKAEKAMRAPIVRAGKAEPDGASAQAALLERVRANGGSLPANGEAEPPAPRNGRRAKATPDRDLEATPADQLASDLHAALEASESDRVVEELAPEGASEGAD